jgi:integration host factor subunit alpha
MVEAVCAGASGLSKREAAEVVEAFFSVIKETLERGETVKIAGFGNFVVRDKNERVGRNPQTGEAITISARRVVTFKASDLLKQKLQEETPSSDAP